ncbi:MAG: tetratricopeptide repeat protein [Aquificaceae bacterium]
MWKPIGLFSLLFLINLVFAQQITKEFDVKVEFIGEIREEKPKLSPPESLPLPKAKQLNLSYLLLEAPKSMEFMPVKPVEKSAGISCGEPKDALSYRLGVDYYLRGRYDLAKEELGKVVVVPNSPFKPMAEYVMGIIAYSEDKKDRALEFFKNSCQISHIYRQAACEAYYALSLMLEGTVPENQDNLWRAVKDIREGKESNPSCEGVVFIQYCQYVSHFIQGGENLLYKDSTLLRSGILSYFSGDLQKAKEIFSKYSEPGRPYRKVALYYLALIEYKENREKQALRHASILESIDPELSKELYAFISERDVYLSRLVYTITKNKGFLEKAGVIAYNSKDYNLALLNFLEAGNIKYAVYSAIKMGDYKRAAQLLRDKKEKDREDYLWLLESLYWSGEDMSEVLREVSPRYPELYKEYMGWEMFRKGDWLGALSFFEDPYYKALALYNTKKYKEVIELLRGRAEERAKLLSARAALMLGDASLARGFLKGNSPEEFYLLGISYFIESDYRRSAELFSKVPFDSPLKPKALLKEAESYYNLGDVQKAKDLYYQVLRRFPDSQEARQALLALLDFKDIKEEEMEKALEGYIAKEENPPPEAIYQLALIKAQKGNKEEAERELLKLLNTPLKFKAILKLAELEEDTGKKLILLYKVYKEATLEEDRKRARDEIISIYTSVGDRKSLADLLSEGSPQDKVKAIGIYLSMGETNAALPLAQELTKAGYRDEEFDRYLLELYKQSKDPSLLEYLLKSPNKSLRGQGLYIQGFEMLRKGDKRKALESFVEISLDYKGEGYYNPAVLEAAKILLELGAKRDASCILNRFDSNKASQEDLKLYDKLKQDLPKCEVN